MNDGYLLLSLGGYDLTLYSAVIICLFLVYFWDLYLSIRQYCVVKVTLSVPPEYKEILTTSQFNKARLYAIDKFKFSFAHGAYDFVLQLIILHYGLMGYIWTLSQNHSIIFSSWLNNISGINLNISKENEIFCSMTLIIYITLFSFVTGLPWSYLETFVLEEKHGFNKQTLSFFIKDKIKGVIVSLIIGLPVSAGIIWVAKVGGQHFYLYTYVFCLAFSLIMMFIYPSLIAPLFDRYEPLPEGSLRTKIEALASSVNFPLKKLFVVEGSKRSAHSNAYFYGFGNNKRIVLFDTLIKGFVFPGQENDVDEDTKDKGCGEDEEIVAVLAHELGHWKKNHILMHIIVSQVNLFFMFVVFGIVIDIESLFTAFGFPPNTAPFLMRLTVVFQFIFLPYNTILGYIMTFVTRQIEFQADRFAVGLGYAEKLKSALVVLNRDNLSFPVYDWLYTAMNHSHPNILDRMNAINVENKKI